MTRPAQYLLRIDDLCVTVHRERWQRLRELVREFGIAPILAVVPENLDAELAVSPADARFWAGLREMEAEGAAAALHGLHHVCAHRPAGLLPLSRSGEFAGVPFATQQGWIRKGLAILRGEGLDAKVWVAPRHNFDTNTLRALRGEGILYVSDGLMREPRLRGGMVWIPQQLWKPVERRAGLWTICVHPNTIDEEGIRGLRDFFARNCAAFTTFDRVAREFSPRPAGWMEILRERVEVQGIRFRHRVRNGMRSRIASQAGYRRVLPSDRGSSAD